MGSGWALDLSDFLAEAVGFTGHQIVPILSWAEPVLFWWWSHVFVAWLNRRNRTKGWRSQGATHLTWCLIYPWNWSFYRLKWYFNFNTVSLMGFLKWANWGSRSVRDQDGDVFPGFYRVYNSYFHTNSKFSPLLYPFCGGSQTTPWNLSGTVTKFNTNVEKVRPLPDGDGSSPFLRDQPPWGSSHSEETGL